MSLREILGGSRRIISEHTVVFETSNGTQPMTPLEQKMYNLLLELTSNGSSHTLTNHGSD